MNILTNQAFRFFFSYFRLILNNTSEINYLKATPVRGKLSFS